MNKDNNLFNNKINIYGPSNNLLIHTILLPINDDNINIIKKSFNNNSNINTISCIINIQDLFVKYIQIGNYFIVEINDYIIQLTKLSYINIYLYTGFNELLILNDFNIYKIEHKNKFLNVWFCKKINFNIIIDLFNNLSNDYNVFIKNIYNTILNLPKIKKSRIINARCNNSMKLLDSIHRKYVNNLNFDNQKNNIIAIKSVAGSGKTTTLLQLSKNNKSKKILYIAFNKSLIDEIKVKIKKQNISNLEPFTFDALMRKCYLHYNEDINIINLRPTNIDEYFNWFKKKRFTLKKSYITKLDIFCNQILYDNINEFNKSKYGKYDKVLESIWNKINNNEFQTFNTIRKLIQINHLCKHFIDNKYDAILIDEAQDFDMVMLKILLEDTNILKIFVGDPKQAIYEWRGCINAFDKLPKNTLYIEFYSTFRIGEPACSKIVNKINNCYMFSNNTNSTILDSNIPFNQPYVYLFRTWKNLLSIAQTTPKIWIYNYLKQKQLIENLHDKIQKYDLSEEEKSDFSDDLPSFLLKLTKDELYLILTNIENNLVSQKDSICQMYTIHSYKGLEHNNIRISNDIDLESDNNEEHNLYYVALTRGMQKIILDI